MEFMRKNLLFNKATTEYIYSLLARIRDSSYQQNIRFPIVCTFPKWSYFQIILQNTVMTKVYDYYTCISDNHFWRME